MFKIRKIIYYFFIHRFNLRTSRLKINPFLLLVTGDAVIGFITAIFTLINQFRLLQADALVSKDLACFLDLKEQVKSRWMQFEWSNDRRHCLCLRSCALGFESRQHNLCFFYLYCCWNEKRTKINGKEVGIGPYLR